ncbi:glycosyltransferase family 39 protein [bacterium]|nr:glycosyltransferase family 39 protein [bacterium]
MKQKPDLPSSGEDTSGSQFAWRRYIPAGLVLLAFILRVLYLFTMRHHPWVALPIVDEIDYDRLARLISLMGFSETLPTFRPPLWPALLGIVYKLFGEQFVLARLLSAALGALSVGSLYRLSIRLFSPRTSLIASALAAFMGVGIHLQSSALATSLLLLLLFEAMIAAIDFRRSPEVRRGLLLGGLFALAVLARPIALLPALVVAVDSLYRLTRNQVRRSLLAAAILFLAIITPLAANNILSGGSAIASNTGINFFLGNRTGADGISPVHPVYGPGWTTEQVRSWAEHDSGQEMNDAQVSTWYIRKVFLEWLDHPAEALKLVGKKLLLTFGGPDISNNGDLHYFRQTRPLLFVTSIVGTWWILPIGLLGALGAWRRSADHRLVLITVLAILLATAAVFVTTRFRLPALLMLLPFAVDYVRRVLAYPLRSISFVKSILVTLVALAVLNVPAGLLAPESNRAYGLLLDGQLYARAGMTPQAIDSYRAALKTNSSTPLAHQSLGFLYLEAGQLDSASNAFRQELVLRENPDSYRGLGLVARQRGDHLGAAHAFKKAFELQPRNSHLLRSQAEEYGAAGASLLESGQLDSSLALLQRAEELDTTNPFYAFGRACILHLEGDTSRANSVMDSLRLLYPRYRAVRDWYEHGWRP